jgi:hypothetical protein
MLGCPTELKGLRAYDLNPTWLYSYWLTIYFIMYAVLYLALQGMSDGGKLVGRWIKWFNPYPMIIIGTVVQFLFFIVGARAMPIYFILGVAGWKLALTLATLAILPVDWSPSVVICNLSVLGCYIIYMIWWHGVNPVDLYTCIESNPDYYPATASEFMRIRFGV